jgi:hypothetical protein
VQIYNKVAIVVGSDEEFDMRLGVVDPSLSVAISRPPQARRSSSGSKKRQRSAHPTHKDEEIYPSSKKKSKLDDGDDSSTEDSDDSESEQRAKKRRKLTTIKAKPAARRMSVGKGSGMTFVPYSGKKKSSKKKSSKKLTKKELKLVKEANEEQDAVERFVSMGIDETLVLTNMARVKDKTKMYLHQKFNKLKAGLTMAFGWRSYEPAYENEGQRGRDAVTVLTNKLIYKNNPLVQVTLLYYILIAPQYSITSRLFALTILMV